MTNSSDEPNVFQTSPQAVPVKEILENYLPVYPKDANWNATFNYLLSTPSESKIVSELVRQATLTGGFREPILLESQESQIRRLAEDDDAVEDKPLVLNGTHRLCAAHLMGWETVQSSYDIAAPEGSLDDYWGPYTVLVTHVHLENAVYLDDDDNDELVSILSSFALDEDTWFRSSLMAGRAGHMEIMWENDPTSVNAQMAKRVDEKIKEFILAHTGSPATKVYTQVEDEDSKVVPFTD